MRFSSAQRTELQLRSLPQSDSVEEEIVFEEGILFLALNRPEHFLDDFKVDNLFATVAAEGSVWAVEVSF